MYQRNAGVSVNQVIKTIKAVVKATEIQTEAMVLTAMQKTQRRIIVMYPMP